MPARAAPGSNGTDPIVCPEDGTFSGYASLFDVPDLSGDVVAIGAFSESLARRTAPDVRMLFQHDPKEPVGVWTQIREDTRGLYVEGRLTTASSRARELQALIGAGALDGLSIGFKAIAGDRNRRTGLRRLTRVDRTLARASRPFPPPSATQGPDQMTDNHAASDIATTERKWWGSSMTIWGAVVTGLAAVLPAIGPALGVEIPKEAVTQGAEQIGAIVQAATGLAGTLMTVLGRIRAAQPISRREFTIRV